MFKGVEANELKSVEGEQSYQYAQCNVTNGISVM